MSAFDPPYRDVFTSPHAARCRVQPLSLADCRLVSPHLQANKIATRVVEDAARIRLWLPAACDNQMQIATKFLLSPRFVVSRSAGYCANQFLPGCTPSAQPRSIPHRPPPGAKCTCRGPGACWQQSSHFGAGSAQDARHFFAKTLFFVSPPSVLMAQ